MTNRREDHLYLSTGIQALDELLSADCDFSRSHEKTEGKRVTILNASRSGRSDGGDKSKIQSSLDIGFKIRLDEAGDFIETPIILIEGDTGTGKTLLALQIGHASIREQKDHRRLWNVYFYSLEQTADSLITMSRDEFDLDHSGIGVKAGTTNSSNRYFYRDLTNHQITIGREYDTGRFNFCAFSPRPITHTDEADTLEQRISELDHALVEVREKCKTESKYPLFIIDSLSALADRSLNRNDIHRLFSLFRTYRIPVLFTIESAISTVYNPEHAAGFARFLADMVIHMTRENPVEHVQFYLEIVKSRLSRQVLGKHLYKIRTKRIADRINTDSRTGIVVYPSIHFILSKVRNRKHIADENKNLTYIGSGPTTAGKSGSAADLALILQDYSIKANSSIAILGPNGTHKLALAVNLAMGRRYQKDKGNKILLVQPKTLILNFGATSDFKFRKMAWTDYNSDFRNLQKVTVKKAGAEDSESQIKFWYTSYRIPEKLSCKMSDQQKYVRTCLPKDFNAVITTFKVGQLTPEECFYIIEEQLEYCDDDRYPGRNHFTSVILSNTAELCTGFPLLKRDSLFLPSLLDLFEAHNLTSIGIGVTDDDEDSNNELNFSLVARADFRINLSHHPSIKTMAEDAIHASNNPNKYHEKDVLTEQRVSLVIDNVLGKQYNRKQMWLSVEPNSGRMRKKDQWNVLKCLPKLERISKS